MPTGPRAAVIRPLFICKKNSRRQARELDEAPEERAATSEGALEGHQLGRAKLSLCSIPHTGSGSSTAVEWPASTSSSGRNSTEFGREVVFPETPRVRRNRLQIKGL